MYLCDLEDTCQFLGFKATQDGLLSCPELRKNMQFIDVLRYDWAHTFLADSMVGQDMWSMIAAGKREGLFDEHTVFELLSQPWSFPGRVHITRGGLKRNRLQSVFNEWRREHHEPRNTVKAQMTELLGLYALLRHFVAEHNADAIC